MPTRLCPQPGETDTPPVGGSDACVGQGVSDYPDMVYIPYMLRMQPAARGPLPGCMDHATGPVDETRAGRWVGLLGLFRTSCQF